MGRISRHTESGFSAGSIAQLGRLSGVVYAVRSVSFGSVVRENIMSRHALSSEDNRTRSFSIWKLEATELRLSGSTMPDGRISLQITSIIVWVMYCLGGETFGTYPAME